MRTRLQSSRELLDLEDVRLKLGTREECHAAVDAGILPGNRGSAM